MLCDHCKERQATIHITKIIHGQKQEHHLCDQCTSLEQVGKEAFDYTGFISDVANESHQTPRKSMPEELTCSRCGMTYDFFRKHGKFGCQHCYDAFEPMITPMIRRMHGKDRHVGKVIQHGDERFQRKREMEALQAMLDAAVEREEYEMAAVYRDQIKALVRTMDQVED